MKKHHLVLSALTIATLSVFTSNMLNFIAAQNVTNAAGSLKLYTTPASIAVNSGDRATVQVRLNKSMPDKVNYVDARMAFNPSSLELVSYSTSGTRFSLDDGPSVSYSNMTGIIEIVGSGEALKESEDVLVVSLTFKTKAVVTSTISFTGESKAGNRLNDKNIRNYLTAMSGSTIAALAPPAPVKPAPIAPAPVSAPQVTQPRQTENPPDAPGEVIDNLESEKTPEEEQDAIGAVGSGGAGSNGSSQAKEAATSVADSSSSNALRWILMSLVVVLLLAGTIGAALIRRKYLLRQLPTQPYLLASEETIITPRIEHVAALGRLALYAIDNIPSDYDIAQPAPSSKKVPPKAQQNRISHASPALRRHASLRIPAR